jgi:hypothetical protein
MIFAVIQSERVMNVIVAESQEQAELATDLLCIEIPADSRAGIGWFYIDGEFTPPPPQPEPENIDE